MAMAMTLNDGPSIREASAVSIHSRFCVVIGACQVFDAVSLVVDTVSQLLEQFVHSLGLPPVEEFAAFKDGDEDEVWAAAVTSAARTTRSDMSVLEASRAGIGRRFILLGETDVLFTIPNGPHERAVVTPSRHSLVNGMDTFGEYVTTPGRPTVTGPESRTRTATVVSRPRPSPRATTPSPRRRPGRRHARHGRGPGVPAGKWAVRQAFLDLRCR